MADVGVGEPRRRGHRGDQHRADTDKIHLADEAGEQAVFLIELESRLGERDVALGERVWSLDVLIPEVVDAADGCAVDDVLLELCPDCRPLPGIRRYRSVRLLGS